MTEQNLNDEGELIMSDNERLNLLGMDDPRMALLSNLPLNIKVVEGAVKLIPLM